VQSARLDENPVTDEIILSIKKGKKLFKVELNRLAKDFPESTSITEFCTILNGIIKNIEQEMPLFLLSYCEDENCAFSIKNSKKRTEFEKKSFEKLSAIMRSKNDIPVNFVGFGCGNLLTEWAILKRTLTQFPTAVINIHLIDPKLKNYFYYKGGSKEHKLFFENATYEDLIRMTLCFNRVKRFKENLTKRFPSAKLIMNIYENKDTYIQSFNKDETNLPDALFAMDLDRDESRKDYEFLKNLTLQKNPNLAHLIAYNLEADAIVFDD